MLEMLKAYDLETLAYDPFASDEKLQALGAKVFRWGTRPKAATVWDASTPATTPPGACEAPAAAAVVYRRDMEI